MEWLQAHLAEVAGAVAAVVVVWMVLKFILPKKKVIADEYKLNVMCRKCKWQGVVTRYNQVCRKCNSRDLDVLKA